MTPYEMTPFKDNLHHSIPDERLINKDKIETLSRLMKNEFESLKEIFINNCNNKLSELKYAINTPDRTAIYAAAHSLKGSCGTIGATEMADIATIIEKQAEDSDTESLLGLVSKLEQTFKDTQTQINKY